MSFIYYLTTKAFVGFNPNLDAKLGENVIIDIASNHAIMLVESIVDNAKCIVKGRQIKHVSKWF